jgi:hypothetical protein
LQFSLVYLGGHSQLQPFPWLVNQNPSQNSMFSKPSLSFLYSPKKKEKWKKKVVFVEGKI